VGKPRLLDLFCGAGGAAMGYHRAGFEVVGVDIRPQPHYPFEFIEADALTYFQLLQDWRQIPALRFDAIHASPPCLPFSKAGARWKDREIGPDLLTPTRSLLEATGRPYVIENVPQAPGPWDILLCGTHFDRPYIKHRYFRCSVPLTLAPMTCSHGRGGLLGAGLVDVFDARPRRIPWREAAALLEVPWMTTRQDMRNAIPPAYTEWIGKQLLAALAVAT
jgi:DNA (cytosine-5)-methyltransferase 1